MVGLKNNISTISVNGSLYTTIAPNSVIDDCCNISLSEGIEKRILEISINNVINKNNELIEALDNILLNRAEELLDNPDSLDDLLLRSRKNIDELLSTVRILESRLANLESNFETLDNNYNNIRSDLFDYVDYRLQNIKNSDDLT